MKRSGLLIVAVLSVLLSACGTSQLTTKADKAYDQAEYYNAINLYKKAYSKEKNKPALAAIMFKTAESYRMTNDTKEAENWYSKAIKGNYADPIAVYQYAQMLKANGKYEEAIAQYNEYQKLAPGDTRAAEGVRSSEMAQAWKDKPARVKMENVADLNGKFSDFTSALAPGETRSVVFSSGREESTGKAYDGWTGQKFTDLFEATMDQKGKWSIPKPLASTINTDKNEGSATFSANGTEMFFTRCAPVKNSQGECKIYSSTKNGNDWSEAVMLPFNTDSSTFGHPSLSADGTMLYFSSDMPGGSGGKDIWVSTKDASGTWGAARNLGPKINTSLDEMYPYIHANGTLYFSSNGHAGMGGLDIFKSTNDGASWSTPANMKSPINSNADDFAVVFLAGTDKTGYLSSNRDGGKGGDDIWSFDRMPLEFTVSGRVYDADTKESLKDAKVELFGSDGTNLSLVTDPSGMYKYSLSENTSYTVSATILDYLNKKLTVSTVGLEESKDFIGDFDFALRSIKKPIELPEIFYDLDKATLRAESKKELDGLIETLNENPNIVIKILSHTDSRATDAYNLDLSNRRAKSVVDYLIANNIAKDRLTSEGRGEKEPRITDAEIDKLGSVEAKETAHQKNRRTEFEVLRTDYVPAPKK